MFAYTSTTRLLIVRFLYIFISYLVMTNVVHAQKTLVFSTAKLNNIDIKVCEEILRVGLKKMNIDLILKHYPMSRALWMSNNGASDGEIARTVYIEPAHPNLLRVDVPCVAFPSYLFIKKKDWFNINGWPSIPEPFTVGYQRGIKYIEDATRINNIKTLRANSPLQLMNLLVADRIQAFVGNQNTYSELLIQRDYKEIIQVKRPLQYLDAFVYLHKKNRQLLDQLTAVFLKMKNNGTAEKIRQSVYASYNVE